MNRIERSYLPQKIEEDIGRFLLFRDNPHETQPLASIHTWCQRFKVARPTFREALQRLLGTGLVVALNPRQFAAPPVDRARGVEALELELRCAETADQRRRALRTWLSCLRHVAVCAFRESLGNRAQEVRRVTDEVERLTGVGYASFDPAEMARETVGVIWFTARASRNEALLLLINSLWRTLPAAEPWLAASVQNRQLADAVMVIEKALRDRDHSRLEDAIHALFDRWEVRLLDAAAHERPEPMEQGRETHLGLP